MATSELVVTSIIEAVGSWTGATVANLEASDDLRATGGAKNDTIKAEITNAPGDFGTQNSVILTVEARTTGATSRDRQVQVDLLDSADTILETFTSGVLTTTDQTFSSAALARSDGQATIDGYRLLATVIEGGGMADAESVEIDQFSATLDYEVAVASDDLTAEDIESTSEVTSPGLGQTHSLAAISIESASEVSAPAIGQAHSLSATSVQSTSEVSSPVLSESAGEDALTADDIQSASGVSAPAIGQEHALSADDVESASTSSVPVLGQDHALAPLSLVALSQVSGPRLDRPGRSQWAMDRARLRARARPR